jgi:hypothetical protein
MRLVQVARTFERVRHRLDLSDVAPAALECLQVIEDNAKRLDELLQPTPRVRPLEGRELWESLATAVVAIARKRCSARLPAKDLKDLIEEHAPEQHMAFWNAQSTQRPVGLLREALSQQTHEPTALPALRKLIQSAGVLFWEEEADREWRLVDTKWLAAHADIYRWMHREWAGGRRCRFCGMQENPHVNALLPVEVERRNGVTMVGDEVVLPMGALTHDWCRPYYVRWSALAARYQSEAQAAEADRAAGRASRYTSAERALAVQVPRVGE